MNIYKFEKLLPILNTYRGIDEEMRRAIQIHPNIQYRTLRPQVDIAGTNYIKRKVSFPLHRC